MAHNYHFKNCYNRYRPFSDAQGFANCAYEIVLQELNYPIDQGVVRNSQIYQLYMDDVYSFCLEVCKSPIKVLRRVPITHPKYCYTN